MKLNFLCYTPKKRRGLTPVVGALFFVMLMVTTITTFGDAFEVHVDTVDLSRQVVDKGLKQQQEEFHLELSTDPLQLLDITVVNEGQNPVEIFTLIITNNSNAAAGYPTTVYDIPSETSFIGSKKQENIISTTPLTMALNNTYGIKVISSLGTIKKGTMICDDIKCGKTGKASLTAQMFLESALGIPTHNVTAVLMVTNNGDVVIDDVEPGFPDPVIEWPPSSSMEGPTFDSTAPVPLGPNQSVLFKWDLVVDGIPGDVWNFTNHAIGLDPSLNLVESLNVTDSLIIVDPSECGGCEGYYNNGKKIIVLNDLLIRPSIFATIPSPIGESDRYAVWGVTVANPTNSTVDISRVVINALSPGSSDQDVMFDISGGAYCNPNSVGSVNYPAVSDDWDCTQQNALVWQNFASQVNLPPFSAQTFLAKVRAGNSGAFAEEANSVLISNSVFSSVGSFGKEDYQTLMIGGSVSKPGLLGNVIMSTEVNGVVDGKIEAMRLNIPANSTETFNMVLVDFDEDDYHAIGVGTEFIINVPTGWKFEGFNSCEGFENVGTSTICDGPNEPTFVVHSDNSTQIIGTTMELIGDVNSVDARTISFNATAPDVTSDSMFVMSILANGRTEPPSSPIGPLSEIVLHVQP